MEVINQNKILRNPRPVYYYMSPNTTCGYMCLHTAEPQHTIYVDHHLEQDQLFEAHMNETVNLDTERLAQKQTFCKTVVERLL